MVALDFPDAPTNGQVYDKWTWNGTQWVLTVGAGVPGIPTFASFTALDAALPAPPDGTCAITLDDGRLYKFAAAAKTYTYAAITIPAPANRWETEFHWIVNAAGSDASGYITMGGVTLNVDGIIAATAFVQFLADGAICFSAARFSAANTLQIRLWSTTVTTGVLQPAINKTGVTLMGTCRGWKN